MKYIGMPMGMWALFAGSFQKQLTAVFGYDADAAQAITKKAKPKYKAIIADLPEFEKADRFKMNIVNCAMLGAFILSMQQRPAVDRLIQARFPSLIGHIVRLKQAMDITAIYARKKFIDKGIPEEQIGIFYVTQCAAKIAAIKCPVGEDRSPVDGVINMDFIYNKILLSINQHKNQQQEKVPEQYHLTPQSIRWTQSGGEASNYKGRCLAIDEIHNVIDILEKMENDELTDIDFLELRACDHSCAGGALTINNRFLTIERLQKRLESYIRNEYVSINKMPRYRDYLIPQMQLTGDIPPRSIEKLDEDFAVAFQKMEKITRIMKVLPQVDCGVCGAPSCKALALDVVQGKAKLNQCIFMQKVLTREGLLTPEESLELSALIWGMEKFDKDT